VTFRIIVLPHISLAKFMRDIYSVTKLTVLTLHHAWQYIFMFGVGRKKVGKFNAILYKQRFFYTREVGRKQVGTF
jgi:hypothetical protein